MIDIDDVHEELKYSIERFWRGLDCTVDGAVDGIQREHAWLDELVRLAKLGAAVEAMPDGSSLLRKDVDEREPWAHKWGGKLHLSSYDNPTFLGDKPLEVLDWIRQRREEFDATP